ncbi:S8 family serine peptidase [Curvibacter sp. RS43]|uniref:S8 family serine peptidase n=1 Tax=Curvibacter microcysteis TaxID=3026419 RepID=UPI0023601920|nr:S8 family serine peptidase [Curvibacter sp. RS43]MDD0812686.1 S8 family serine peptidase [Curvibacter sp. RS43]
MTFPISASPTWRKAHGTLTAVALATSMLCAAHPARAQAQSSPSSDLASELQRRFDDQQAEIARYLANNPGVQREVLRDGAVYRIVRIGSDGQPIYIKNKGVTFNSRSNVESGQLIKADSLYPGGSLGVNITGQNMVVGVWEPGVPRATHELLAGKITIEANQLGSTTDSARNHATHVTGTIIGKTGITGNGASAQGIAYSASSRNWDSDNDTAEMYAAGLAVDGVQVSNHSYGYANDNTIPVWQFGAYDSESRAWDQVISSLVFYQPFVAAGNEQQANGNPSKGGYDLMTGASAAKNVVTVGAVNADKTMSDYSNWGPTDDGRLKPEIVARGTGINSATATSDTAYSGSASDSSGTSYATPAVTAGALLLQQYYRTRYAGNYMRSDTLRALMFGTAEDLGRPGPDHQFGWGLLNVQNAASAIKQRTTPYGQSNCTGSYLASELRGAIIDELSVNPNNNGAAACYRSLYARGGVPLVVNIAWNDDPGPEQTAAAPVDDTTSRVIYNFDIEVSELATGNTFRPWKIPDMAHRTDNATLSTAAFDDMGQNFKQVIIPNPVADTEYRVIFRKHSSSPAATKAMALVVTGTSISNARSEVRGTPAVTGTAQVGLTLTSSYSYWDFEEDIEGASTYRWVWATPAGRGVTRTTIAGATARSYTPVSNDLGKALQFCVTPVAAAGNTGAGTEVCSGSTLAVAAPAPVNASCGSSANSASTYLPAANLCLVGTAGVVSAGTRSWSWSCNGSGGGNAATCSAPFSSVATGSEVGAIQPAGNNNWQIRSANSGFVSPPASPPTGVSFPQGATKVVLDSGTPGSSTTVTLRFSSIPAGAQLYKYGKENGLGDTNKWFAYPATIDAQAGTVVYTLTDGQKGDNDWTANGVIDDPVALGIGLNGQVSGVPTLSAAAAWALSALLVVASMLPLRRRRACT